MKEIVAALGGRLIQRKDVKAIQHPNGAWNPIDEPFSMKDFEDHIAGRKTFGHYMVDQGGECKYFAFDIDIRKVNEAQGYEPRFDPRAIWLMDDEAILAEHGPDALEFKVGLRIQLRCMAQGLAMASARRLESMAECIAVADSGGKGLHVYVCTGSIPADVAKTAAMSILEGFGPDVFRVVRGENFWACDMYPDIEIEIFPKQRSMEGKAYGNLMKLPLGVHRHTGRRSFFISLKNFEQGYADPWDEIEPMKALSGDFPWE